MNDAEFKKLVTQAIKDNTVSVAVTLDPRYSNVLAEMQQESKPAVPVTESQNPTQTEPTGTQPGANELNPPLTKKEGIRFIKMWVGHKTPEEMMESFDLIARTRGSDISKSEFQEMITKYAPDKTLTLKDSDLPPYPPELTPLIESGVAFHQDGFWLLKRCNKCGNFKTKCCGDVGIVGAVDHGQRTLTWFGRQAVGLEPIRPPKPPKTLEQIQQEVKQNLDKNPWWVQFRGSNELEGNGNVKMYIENFLPEGITLICGLPKEGKSWLALAMAKALTSGRPLFGKPGFEVPESVPVLYLAAESGDGALKLRCQRLGITTDKTMFIARTLSQGPMFSLDDPAIESLVRAMKPVIILETLIRFNDGTDEDSATENRKLAESLFRLIGWGARAVVGIHHSRKDLDKKRPTKEAAVRGSGDGLAMPDAVWLVMQDETLYQGGKGPNEIEIVGWGRDFNPVPMRLALTRKSTPEDDIEFAPGIVSCIDAEGDLQWVKKGLVFKPSPDQIDQDVERLVSEDPTITLEALTEKTASAKGSKWKVRKALERLGYNRGQGEATATQWTKTAV